MKKQLKLKKKKINSFELACYYNTNPRYMWYKNIFYFKIWYINRSWQYFQLSIQDFFFKAYFSTYKHLSALYTKMFDLTVKLFLRLLVFNFCYFYWPLFIFYCFFKYIISLAFWIFHPFIYSCCLNLDTLVDLWQIDFELLFFCCNYCV